MRVKSYKTGARQLARWNGQALRLRDFVFFTAVLADLCLFRLLIILAFCLERLRAALAAGF